jgi:UDP-2,3-diacylglucosamine pyrophosphatase LpxH
MILLVAYHQFLVAFVCAFVWAFLHLELSELRPSVDPAKLMAERAEDLVRLFPASFVVMGHTHVPDTRALADATYVNLGSWAEGEPEKDETKPYRAARTHLVIHDLDDRHEAHLLKWKDGRPEEMSALVRALPA